MKQMPLWPAQSQSLTPPRILLQTVKLKKLWASYNSHRSKVKKMTILNYLHQRSYVTFKVIR